MTDIRPKKSDKAVLTSWVGASCIHQRFKRHKLYLMGRNGFLKTLDAIPPLKYSVPQCIHFNPKGYVMLKEDVGAELYKTWSNAQRRDEIAKLVQGYRSGLPASMLCKISESIAGNRKRARKYLQEMMTPDERQVAVNSESGDMMAFVRGYLL